jgi:hypothetical protein
MSRRNIRQGPKRTLVKLELVCRPHYDCVIRGKIDARESSLCPLSRFDITDLGNGSVPGRACRSRKFMFR